MQRGDHGARLLSTAATSVAITIAAAALAALASVAAASAIAPAGLGPRIRRGMRGCRGHVRDVGQDVHARGGCLPASVPSTSSSATHAAAANDVHNVRPPFVWLRPARHLVVHTGPPLLSAERGWRL